MIIYCENYAVKGNKIHKYTVKERLRGALVLILFGVSSLFTVPNWILPAVFILCAYIRWRYQTISYTFDKDLSRSGKIIYRLRKLAALLTISCSVMITPLIFLIKYPLLVTEFMWCWGILTACILVIDRFFPDFWEKKPKFTEITRKST